MCARRPLRQQRVGGMQHPPAVSQGRGAHRGAEAAARYAWHGSIQHPAARAPVHGRGHPPSVPARAAAAGGLLWRHTKPEQMDYPPGATFSLRLQHPPPRTAGSNLTKPGRRAHRTGCRAAEALLAHDAMRTRRADHDGAAGRDEARREPAGAARVGPCVPGPETRRGTWARGPVTCCARRGAGMRMRAGAQGVRALL